VIHIVWYLGTTVVHNVCDVSGFLSSVCVCAAGSL
jgi:hypothetical protein